jgi:hypothetical protein
MTQSLVRGSRFAAALGALIVVWMLAVARADAAGAFEAGQGGRDTLVPTGPNSSGFGPYRDGARPAGDVIEMRRLFGKPDTTHKLDANRCNIRWRDEGISADFVVFGTDQRGPCKSGTLVEARLTKSRWHTKSGVRPGSPRRVARRESLRRCTQDTCGVKGFALELHRNDCAAGRVPGVIARTAKGEVTALVVRWRGCE